MFCAKNASTKKVIQPIAVLGSTASKRLERLRNLLEKSKGRGLNGRGN